MRIDDGKGETPRSDSNAGEEEEEDDPAKDAMYKEQILKWVVDADFTKEHSLTEIARHKFKLDAEEVTDFINTEGIFKIIKV